MVVEVTNGTISDNAVVSVTFMTLDFEATGKKPFSQAVKNVS